MTFPRTSRTLLAITLLTAFTGANAAAPALGSNINASNVQFGVIDLTPNDGQTGSYTRSSYQGSEFSLLITDSPQRRIEDEIRHDVPWSGSATTQASYGSSHATSSATGIFGQGQSSATLSGTGIIHGVSGFYSLMNGMLSPHTALVLTGRLSMTASQAGGDPTRDTGAFSTAYFKIGTTSWPFRESVLSLVVRAGSSLPSDALDQDFRLTFSNNSNVAQEVQVDMQYRSTVFNEISAVPEPSSYAMLGAGLLLLGAVARRKKNATQA